MDAPDEISFIVDGNPVAKPRQRFKVVNGVPVPYKDSDHPIHAFTKAIILAARVAGAVPHDDDVELDVVAIFGRPPSHWNKTGLSPKAPLRPPKNDWDNVGKAVSDALNGVAYRDDEQVIDGHVRKRYAARNEPARTVVTIRRV